METTRDTKSSGRGRPRTSSTSPEGIMTGPLHSFRVGHEVFTVDQRYTPIGVLGRGSYGIVVSATDSISKRVVAIKKVPNLFNDPTFTKRCLREIKLLRHLRNHPHIVQLHSLLRPPGQFNDVYMVMEYLETDLRKTIYSHNVITDDHRQYFLYQILSSLHYIHSAGVVHRDLKPGNILLNENCRLKLCDFNLARNMGKEDVQSTLTEYVVSRWYRAPEVVLCSAEYNSMIDMWSVGCIIVEMHTQKALFAGHDCLDQLNCILHVRGTPSDEDMMSCCLGNDDALAIMQNLPNYEGVNLQEMCPDMSDEELDLVNALLQFNPKKRPTAREALQHPYLKHYKPKLADCPDTFSFDMKGLKNMDRQGLEQIFTEEMASMRSENKRRRRRSSRHHHSSSRRPRKTAEQQPSSSSPSPSPSPSPSVIPEEKAQSQVQAEAAELGEGAMDKRS